MSALAGFATGAVGRDGLERRGFGGLAVVDGAGLIGVRLVEGPEFDRVEVVRHVRDRPPIQLERLAMRVHQRGLAGAGDRSVERLPAKAGPLVVDRGVDLRRPLQRRAEFAGSGMEAPALGVRDTPVQHVAQELVAVVVVAVRHRGEDHVVHELLERCLERLDGQVHDPREHVGREAASDDRARPGRRLGLPGAVGHPREDGVVDRLRHLGVADRRAIGPRLGTQGAEQFLDVERDPVGTFEDGGRHVA